MLDRFPPASDIANFFSDGSGALICPVSLQRRVITMEFIGGLGIGSLLASLILLWLRRRYELADRKFREMTEAYAGLLKVVGPRPLDPEEIQANERSFRYWVARAMLVCPEESFESISELSNVNHFRANRDALILMMRHDLQRVK